MRRAFNRLGLTKAGQYAIVHIVDNNGLMDIVRKHPFNDNLNKIYKRDRKFPLYLQLCPAGAVYFIICDTDNKIIASATLRTERNRSTEMKISQISVHKDFRNQGYATRLLTTISEYMNTAHPDIKRLSISKFKPMGWKFLRPKFIELSSHFKAETFETEF